MLGFWELVLTASPSVPLCRACYRAGHAICQGCSDAAILASESEGDEWADWDWDFTPESGRYTPLNWTLWKSSH